MTSKRFRVQSFGAIVVVAGAVLAALAVFTRPPELIILTSVDGVVKLSGEVPRSIGGFRIHRDDDARAQFSPDGSTPVYRIEPAGMWLPQSVTLLFSLAGVETANPETLALALWNDVEERWELVPSSYDARTNAIRAPIRTLGWWTLRER